MKNEYHCVIRIEVYDDSSESAAAQAWMLLKQGMGPVVDVYDVNGGTLLATHDLSGEE